MVATPPADALETVIIDRFDGGISDNPRQPIVNQGILISHADIITDQHQVIPFRSSEEDTQDGSGSTDMRQYSVSAFHFDAASGRLYGLGVNGSGHSKLFYKTSPGNSTNWTAMSNAEGNAIPFFDALLRWVGITAKTDTSYRVWFIQGNTLAAVDTTGLNVIENSVLALTGTITSVAPPLVSPTDNCAYFFYNTTLSTGQTQPTVARVDANGVGTDNVVPLPIGYFIRSACLYGNYISIALSTGSSTGKSIVVLWIPTLSNFTEVVDFGDGEIKVLENLTGALIAFMDVGVTGTFYTDVGGSGKLMAKQYSAGGAVPLKMLGAVAAGTTFPGFQKVVRNGAVYFPMAINYDGTQVSGIWMLRKNAARQIVLSLAYADANVNYANLGRGFYVLGDVYFTTDSSNGKIWKTLDSPGNTFTTIIESQIFYGSTPAVQKQIHSFFATYVPFINGTEQIVMKYKRDSDTSWTTIFTETATGAIRTERGAGAGIALPKWREIRYRIESTGGAILTGYGFRNWTLGGPTND